MADAPAKEKKAEEDVTTEQPPKKKSKLLIIVALVVVLAGGGGAAWFFLAKGKSDSKEAAVAHEAKAAPIKPPVFVPIDPFTVNLTPGNGEQYLQVSATLRVLDEHAGEAVKQYMPEVRHRMLLLLSSKKAAEILTMDGRERLAEELRVTTNNILLVAAGKEPKPLVDKDKSSDKSAEKSVDKGVEKGAAKDAGKGNDKDGNKGKGESKAPAPAGENPEAKPADGEPPKDEATPEGEPAASSARAAADDPVQSVLFTSFIIQ